MLAKLLDIAKAVDFKTAGWKTYTGLGVAALALAGGTFGGPALDAAQSQAGIAFGLLLAGVGKVAADSREAQA